MMEDEVSPGAVAMQPQTTLPCPQALTGHTLREGIPSGFPQYVARRCKKTFADTGFSSGSKLTALDLQGASDRPAGRAESAAEGACGSGREWGNGAGNDARYGAGNGTGNGAGSGAGNGASAVDRREDGQQAVMRCPVVGCGVLLQGVFEYEAHYASTHQLACSVCGRGFPSDRFLTLHVTEAHDSFFQARAARGLPVFECLVETCGDRFTTDPLRLQHLVQRHHFPPTFRFHGIAPVRHPKGAHPHKPQMPRGKAAQGGATQAVQQGRALQGGAQAAQQGKVLQGRRGQAAQQGTAFSKPGSDMDMEGEMEGLASTSGPEGQGAPRLEGQGVRNMGHGADEPMASNMVAARDVARGRQVLSHGQEDLRRDSRFSAARDSGAEAMEQEERQGVAQLEGALSQLSVFRAFIPRQVSMSRAVQGGGRGRAPVSQLPNR